MKTMIRKPLKSIVYSLNSIVLIAAGAFAVSCADYNVTDDFQAQPDPTIVEPYKDLDPIKSYIDRSQYPNLTLGAQLKVAEFNKQELAHAACVTNCDNANMDRTLDAAQAQITAIENLRKTGQYESLSPKLKEIAELRVVKRVKDFEKIVPTIRSLTKTLK